MRNYLAEFKEKVKSNNLWHSGVKGMKWGVRRSSSQLAAAAKARGDAPAKPAQGGQSSTAKKPSGNIQDNVESSPARYARLQAQAKEGKASEMSEADLKFYNGRTQALATINKINETQPSWLKDTATKVIQQSAQRQMQSLSDTLADKYIGAPLTSAIKGKEAEVSVADAIASGAAAKMRKTAIDKGIEDLIKKRTA